MDKKKLKSLLRQVQQITGTVEKLGQVCHTGDERYIANRLESVYTELIDIQQSIISQAESAR